MYNIYKSERDVCKYSKGYKRKYNFLNRRHNVVETHIVITLIDLKIRIILLPILNYIC